MGGSSLSSDSCYVGSAVAMYDFFCAHTALSIWSWWKIIFLKDEHSFAAFKLAIRLVVLSKLSSCSVERVFLRLKMIRDSCKDSMFEDMLENIIMIQCNGNLENFLADSRGHLTYILLHFNMHLFS